MDKRIIMIGAVVGMLVGSFVPMLWGDNNMFGLAGLLWGTIGGFVGIWAAVLLSRNLDL